MLTPDALAALRLRLETAGAIHGAGDIGGSAQIYRAVLNDYPDQPDALHMLGIIAQQMGKTELAVQLFDAALKSYPDSGQIWANRAVLLHATGRSDEAFQSATQAIAKDPNLADGWNIMGLLLRERRDYESSYEHHARAVALKPDHSGYHQNHATILSLLGRVQEAVRAAQTAVQLNPRQATAYMALANVLGDAGYLDRAMSTYQQAQAIDPNLIDAYVNEGRAALLAGDMERGWNLLEKRRLHTYDDVAFAKYPRWQGQQIDHLLIATEQGIGDTLQFLRYIPLIRDRTKRITLHIPKSLHRSVAHMLPDVSLIAPGDALPPADAFDVFMSLPQRCQTRLNDIPTSIPYMSAKEEWRAPWQERLKTIQHPRLGIVWAGNPFHRNDLNRSLTLGQMKPLIDVAAPNLISLQKGPLLHDLTAAGIFDAAAALNDFADTSGLIAELDLVIAVDTALAHLAGAMGKPVWLLVGFAPDWRWMLEREDSPWYPSLRLFRQTAPRDWKPVLARMAGELQKFLSGDTQVLKPKAWMEKPLLRNPHALPLAD